MSLNREHYPVLNEIVYANTAGSGLLSEPLYRWRRQRDLQWLQGREHALPDISAVCEHARSTVADFTGTRPERVSLVPNFSWGMNAVAAALCGHGPRVAVLENDYPSLVWPLQDWGGRISTIDWGRDMEDRIFSAVRKEAPEVFALSMVQWIDGRKLPLDFYRRLKAEFPSLLILADATQYLGTEAFSFEGSGIDILGCSGYKWLLSGYGNGFFVFSDYASERLDIRVVGSNSTLQKSGARERVSLNRSLEPGHLDALNFGGLAFSLEYLQNLGLERIGRQLEVLAEATWQIMDEVDSDRLPLADRSCHGSIYWFPCGKETFENLNRNGVICSWRNEGIRVSWHFYNTLEDVAGFLSALTPC